LSWEQHLCKEVRWHAQVLLKTLIFLPEAASQCLAALQALLMMHAQQRADFVNSGGTAKLCTILGEAALGESALQRGMELLCTLCFQLSRTLLNSLVCMTWPSIHAVTIDAKRPCSILHACSAGDLESVLLEGAKEIHLNAYSVLTQFAASTVLSEHALMQAAAQLLALL
jgi:hypothetical protein